ncbi:MAG: MmgE/PrpD family protein [Steroidobacteraceae bacterium]
MTHPVDFTLAPPAADAAALDGARSVLFDALAAALNALLSGQCAHLFGPPLQGMTMPGGARIPGTSLELDPVQAAFSLGLLLRWHAHEGDHCADTLGPLLAVFDYRARQAVHSGEPAPLMSALLRASITAQALQNRIDSDDAGTRLRAACALLGTAALGGSAAQLHAALNDSLRDGVEPARRWRVANAGSRGVWHALMAMRGAGDEAIAHTLRAATPPAQADHAGARERLNAAITATFPPRQVTKINATLVLPAEDLRVGEFLARFVRN